MSTDQVRPQLALRTCRRAWLRAKLYFMVTHDDKGKQELKKLLDDIAGRRIEIFPLMLAITFFVDEDDESELTALFFAYMAVPFWQWRKLSRLMKLANDQLGAGSF